VTLGDDDFAQFLSPLDLSLQPSASNADPWAAALEGVKLFLKAASDAPVGCNDAFVALAQAAKDGPDAMSHALERAPPTCGQSRSLIRLTTILADGTPLEFQQEVTLDESWPS
jgi:hypothetical protein